MIPLLYQKIKLPHEELKVFRSFPLRSLQKNRLRGMMTERKPKEVTPLQRNIPLLWIAKRIRRRIPALFLMTGAFVATALLGVAFALGTRDVIDCATSGQKDDFIRACIVQGAIIAGLLASQTLSHYLQEKLRAQLDRDWKKDLLHQLLHGDFSTVSAYHSGELMNRLNNDVKAVNDGILSALPSVASTITKIAAAIGALLAMEPIFTLILLAAGAVLVIFTGLLRRRMKLLQKHVSEEEGKVSSLLQESLEKLLMIQALDVADQIELRSDNAMHRRYQAQRKRKNATLLANTGLNIMYYGAGFAALAWCSIGLLQGTITFGSLTAVTQLVNQLQSPFVRISGIFPQYIAMITSAERLIELENLDPQPSRALENPQHFYRSLTAIGAENLTFSYDRDLVLEDACFRIPKGSFAVITGPSGIGKSTLLKLLLGIFRPAQGQLYFETEEGRSPVSRSTRRMFAYVPQGNLLLSGTLRENLTITRPDATEKELAQAVYVSAMDEFLPGLPQGLDTILGEGGAGLSEGQSQRLAIARAILSGAPVILLDEGTSALDAETEKLVLQRICSLPDRTCIAVTHRPAAIELCDRNIEMQDGKLTVKAMN